jgi:hypothetical protein
MENKAMNIQEVDVRAKEIQEMDVQVMHFKYM